MAWTLVYDQRFPAAQTYTGESEQCVVRYSGHTTPQALASAATQEVAAKGGTPLRISIYQDGIEWQCQITAHGTPLALIWTLIVAAIAIICVVVVVAWAVRAVAPAVSAMIWSVPAALEAIPTALGEVITAPVGGIPWGLVLIGGIIALVLWKRKPKERVKPEHQIELSGRQAWQP